MSGDWLWDKSGKPDPDVEALERKLAPARYRPRAFEVPETGASDAGAEAGSSAPDATLPAGDAKQHVVVPLEEMRRRRAGELSRGAKAAVMSVVLVAAGLALYFGLERPQPVATILRIGRPPDAPWRHVEARLTPGEWLETGTSWEARVAISDIGRVEVAPSTRLRLTHDTPERQRLELARGKIHAKVVAPPALFVVGTPAAEAIDMGCEYTLDVDDKGNGELVVLHGWVKLETDQRWAYVPAGARAPMRQDVGPGVPHYQDAPAALRAALARFEAGEAPAESVHAVMREARRKDSLTLYHLIQRVDDALRRQVVERLSGLVPPPTGVDKADVIRLDRGALEAWGNQMSVTW